MGELLADFDLSFEWIGMELSCESAG